MFVSHINSIAFDRCVCVPFTIVLLSFLLATYNYLNCIETNAAKLWNVCVFVVEAWVWRHRWPTVKIVGTPASDFGPPRDKIITDLIGANRTKFYFALPPMAFGDICNIDSNWIFYGWPHALAHSDDPANTIHIITIIIMHRVEKMCDDKLIFYSCCDWLEAIGINAVCCVLVSA